jgi:hypothetical protein
MQSTPTAFAAPLLFPLLPPVACVRFVSGLRPVLRGRGLRSSIRCCMLASAGLSATSQEAVLLSCLITLDLGRNLSPEARDRIDLLVQVLEGLGSFVRPSYPANLSILDGPWTLLYSSSPLPPPRLPFVLPGTALRVTGLEQVFDTPARTLQNSILLAIDPPLGLPLPTSSPLPSPPLSLKVAITADFTVTAPDSIRLALSSAEVRVRLPGAPRHVRASPVLPLGRLAGFAGQRGSQSADVTTTYYGEHVRVARSPGGEMRVFCRPVQ